MLNIANNKDQFLNSLFVPINGKTYDGYITKRTKTGVRVFMLGEEFHINRHGVLCAMSKIDGKTWYSFAPFHVTDKIGTFSQKNEFCRELLNRGME